MTKCKTLTGSAVKGLTPIPYATDFGASIEMVVPNQNRKYVSGWFWVASDALCIYTVNAHDQSNLFSHVRLPRFHSWFFADACGWKLMPQVHLLTLIISDRHHIHDQYISGSVSVYLPSSHLHARFAKIYVIATVQSVPLDLMSPRLMASWRHRLHNYCTTPCRRLFKCVGRIS